jgi:hypothetical protein
MIKIEESMTESAIDPPSQRTFPGFDNRTSAGPGFRPYSAPTSIHYQGFYQKPLLTEIYGAFFFEKSNTETKNKGTWLGRLVVGGARQKNAPETPII